jgi:hypothetical protein
MVGIGAIIGDTGAMADEAIGAIMRVDGITGITIVREVMLFLVCLEWG